MDNLRDDLIVIVAGYPDKMNEFMNLNEGLRSRFPNWIHFVDYSPEEMQQIFCKMVEDNHYILDNDTEDSLMAIWNNSKNVQDFGNGRGIRNIYEKIIVNQTNRIVGIKNPSKEALITIKRKDISEDLIGTPEKPKKKIGFHYN